ncbi:MAG TPA: YciI family protein [Jiangellaceae bacterium]|nr:YciI family protein [Jiangellaceae bacterium]
MRFMVMVRADESTEAGDPPSREFAAAMARLNDEMAKAGVLLATDGLAPSSRGARITFAGDQRTVTDGPFTEAKEMIAGYALLQVRSKEEAIEWASRMPFAGGEVVEIRQVFEASDFAPEHPIHDELKRRTAAP